MSLTQDAARDLIALRAKLETLDLSRVSPAERKRIEALTKWIDRGIALFTDASQDATECRAHIDRMAEVMAALKLPGDNSR